MCSPKMKIIIVGKNVGNGCTSVLYSGSRSQMRDPYKVKWNVGILSSILKEIKYFTLKYSFEFSNRFIVRRTTSWQPTLLLSKFFFFTFLIEWKCFFPRSTRFDLHDSHIIVMWIWSVWNVGGKECFQKIRPILKKNIKEFNLVASIQTPFRWGMRWMSCGENIQIHNT